MRLALTITPATADNKAVVWTTSNAGIATVDQNGNVTFLSAGKVTIRATALDGSKKVAGKAFTVK